jgi:hypothetical protein
LFGVEKFEKIYYRIGEKKPVAFSYQSIVRGIRNPLIYREALKARLLINAA